MLPEADFSGLILEAPFNNFVEAASSHPLSAVCCNYRLLLALYLQHSK